jgi:bacteriorhodopsin
MIIIPISIVFIILYFIIFIYYIYSSIQYKRTISEKQIFYINSIITLIPPVLYIYNIINIIVYNHPLELFILQNFNIEWSIATPLILLNITQVARVKSFKQLLLCVSSVAMNLCGFLANGFHDRRDILISYSVGLFFLVFIFGSILWMYYKRNWVFFKDTIEYKKYVYCLNGLFYSVLSTWTLYPIVFILYKYTILNIEYTSVCFMFLDFISKGIFIWTSIRYADIMYMTDSFTNQIRLSELANAAAINQVAPSAVQHHLLEIPRRESASGSSMILPPLPLALHDSPSTASDAFEII